VFDGIRGVVRDEVFGDEDARVGRACFAEVAEDGDACLVWPVVEDAADLVNERAWSWGLAVFELSVYLHALFVILWERTFDWLLLEEAGDLPLHTAHNTGYICVDSLVGLILEKTAIGWDISILLEDALEDLAFASSHIHQNCPLLAATFLIRGA
jgi:hypothetical protein